jgi:NAD(P) transhydrogenase subunit alpha
MKRGAVAVGFLRPLDEPMGLLPLAERGMTAFAMERIPRITRAQAMDALSSQASVAGYKAVALAAARIPRMFPMLMTAAGTVAPARVLVLGAGVAGLQAIATARRLGAVVEAYDIRPDAGEAVRSLGATFLEMEMTGLGTQDAGGYAVELTETWLERIRDLLDGPLRRADVVIATAQVPGKRAPRMIPAASVDGMKRGSVIVDLAAPTGGNCELTAPGEERLRDGVAILGPLNLPGTVPVHASQLYSNNVAAFLGLLLREGRLEINLEDDVVGPSCVIYNGKVLQGAGKP